MQLMSTGTISADVYEVFSRLREADCNVKLNEMYWLRNYVYMAAYEKDDEYRADIVTAEGLWLKVIIWRQNGKTVAHVELSSIHAGNRYD